MSKENKKISNLESEIKSNKENFMQTDSKFKAIFDNMASGCCFDEIIYENGKAVDYVILDVNPAYEKILGVSRNEVVGQLASKVYNTKDIPFLDIYAKVVETGVSETFDSYFEPAKKYLQITTTCPEKGKFSNVFTDITERKILELEMKESEENFRALFENSPVGKSMTKTDGSLYVNTAFSEMVGYTEDELKSKKWMEISHPDDIQQTLEYIDSMLAGKISSCHFAKRYIHKNGQIVCTEVSTYLQRDKDGKPQYFITNVVDITEHKKSTANIKLNEARLESLLRINQYPAENIQDLLNYTLEEAIALTESKLGYIYFYDEIKKEFTLNTWSREVLPQCSVAEPMTIYQLEKTGIWGEAVRQRKPIIVNDFEAFNPLKKGMPEGHAVLNKFLTIPIFNENNIVAVVGVANKKSDYNESDIRQLNLMMDAVWKIVQRKQIDEDLKKSEEEFRAIFENNSAAIAIIDFDTTITMVNDAYCQLSGFTPQEVIGMSWTKQIPPKDLERLKEYNKKRILNPKDAPDKYEFSFYKKGGEIRRGLMSVSLIRNSNKIVTSFTDITERSRIEKALEESEIKYRSLFTEMSEGFALHELVYDESKTPIDYRIIDVNPAFEKQVGIPLENAKDALATQLYGVTPAPFIDVYSKVVETGENITFQTYFPQLDRYFEVSAFCPKQGYFATVFLDISDRKQKELELIKSEEKYRNIFENVQDVFYEASLEGIVLEISPSISIVSNGQYKREEVIGMSLYDIYASAKNRDTLVEILKEKGKVNDFEVNLKNKDGAIIVCSVNAKLIFDPKGNPIKISGSMRDISQRRQSEALLLESEKKFRRIAENITDVVWSADLDFNVTYTSPSIERMVGIPVEKYMGLSLEDNYTPESLNVIYSAFSEEIEKEKDPDCDKNRSRIIEAEHYHANGSTIWVDMNVSFIRDENGIPIGVQGVDRDISERKLAEAKLKEREEFLSAVIENIPDMIFIKEAKDLRFVRLNKAAEKYFGQDLENIIGLNDYDIFPKEQADFFIQKDRDVLNDRGLLDIPEEPIRTADGEFLLHTKKIPIMDKDGNPAFLLGISEDITERKKIEELIRVSAEKWEATFNSITDIISVISVDHIFLEINKAGCDALGLDRKDIIGKKCYELVHNIHKPFEGCPCISCVSSNTMETSEIFDHGRYYEVTAWPIFDKEGVITAFSHSTKDITENKIAEIALKDNYKLLSTAGKIAKFGGWNVELEKSISHWSDEVAAIHEMPAGYAPLVSEGINFYAPEWRDKITKVFTDCAEKGIPYDEEMEIITSTGKRIWIRTIGEAVKDSQGKIISVQGFFQDINDRKQAELELKESNDRFKAISDYSHNAICIVSEQAKIVWANEALVKLGNYPLEAMYGAESFAQFLAPESVEFVVSNFMKFVSKQDYEHFYSFFFIRSDGQHRLCEKFMTDYEDINGKRYLVISMLDVTDRTQTEDALKRSENHYKLITEKNTDVIWLMDLTGKSFFVSPFIERFTGFSMEEYLKQSIQDRFTKESGAYGMQIFSRELTKFKDHPELLAGYSTRMELEYVCKNGGTKWGELIISPYFVDEKLVGIHGVTRDITDRKKNEEELKIAKEKAEESDRLKTAFLHNISHEIRTPMNAIMGFSDFFKDPDLVFEKRMEYAEIVIQSSSQLLSIITDIINIATIQAGQVKLYENEVNLNSVFNLLFEQYNFKAQKLNILLRYKAALTDDDSVIVTDETKLIQILSNLVNNALKYTKLGYIEFGYHVKNELIEFYVEDTGIGIPLDMHEKIFDRFSQVQSETTSRIAGGSGLGLSISKAYVELLGGKLSLNSEIGKGSVFYFAIPYKKKEIQPKVIDHKSEEQKFILSKSKTILIAEDEDSNYLLLEALLVSTGINVKRAINGEEAVNLCKSDLSFDLVLMDIKMPVMDGYEATLLIKQIKPELPIIAQTAYYSEHDRKIALEVGCVDFISKPLKRDILLPMIKLYLKI